MTTDAGAPGAPRFDVVLRGYDRRQVDEHVARLQRVLARMRADLEVARSQPNPVVSSPSPGFPPAGQPMPGGRPRPTPRPRPGPLPGESPDSIGNFTDRMQSILQAAEEEAAEIRNKAHAAARAETQAARAEVADLVRQRDAVLAELTRMRGQLEGLLSAPTTRITLPTREGTPSPSRPRESGPGSGQAPTPGHTGSAQPGAGNRGIGQQGAVPGPGQDSPKAAGQGARGVGPEQAGSWATSASGQPSAPRPSAGPRPSPSPNPSRSGGSPSGGSVAQPPGASDGTTPNTRPTSSTDSGADAHPGGPESSKSAAHRLPTGAYPIISEKHASMRPRTEPDPEPGDLFRPASDPVRPPAEPQTAAVRQQPTGGGPGDRTALVPTVQPPTPNASAEAKSPSGARPTGDVETTVKVGVVRPAPADGKPGQAGRSNQADAPSDGDAGPSESGGNGSGGANRSTSASRSG